MYFSLTSADLQALASFYRDALGCRILSTEVVAGAQFEVLMGVPGGARRICLELGQQRIELLQFDRAVQRYPPDVAASDLRFQHFAIVVADMSRACAQLARTSGWTAISRSGPQRLPAASGGVTAYKFRDPEGHPLELLSFAPGQAPPAWRNPPPEVLHLGLDHSAISVADTERSIAFYAALGFTVSARSLNLGPEQARLDDVLAPQVEVTALSLPHGGPHLELLCYRGVAHAESTQRRNNDIATTRMVLQDSPGQDSPGQDSPGRCLVDPDGHFLICGARRPDGPQVP